ISDVVEHCQKWINSGQRLLILAGDFGTGKTTILKRIQYDLARQIIEDQPKHCPIYMELRNLRHHDSLWSFIEASLRDQNFTIPPQRMFYDQINMGRCVFLLDGFDEIHTGATARDRAEYLKRLAPLLVSSSPCIVSTRPTYFESFYEMMTAFKT